MRKLLIVSIGIAGMAMAPPVTLAQVPSPDAYPLCTHPGQDQCQNPGEGGAPGRSRAADYSGGPSVYSRDEGVSHAAHHTWRHRHHTTQHRTHRRY